MTIDTTRKVMLTVHEAEALLRMAVAADDQADDERRALAHIEDQLRKLRRRETAR